MPERHDTHTHSYIQQKMDETLFFYHPNAYTLEWINPHTILHMFPDVNTLLNTMTSQELYIFPLLYTICYHRLINQAHAQPDKSTTPSQHHTLTPNHHNTYLTPPEQRAKQNEKNKTKNKTKKQTKKNKTKKIKR
ncbi:MAG: hypothetical protein RML35_12130 [Chloroherpetonaceae bacterium]|nr:hypothetical protein [Chloroherpetonaceae bacterium]